MKYIHCYNSYTTHIQSVCHQAWKYINNVVQSVLCRALHAASQLAIANLKLNTTLSRSTFYGTHTNLNTNPLPKAP